jgi:hypothetical protein
MKFQKLVVDDLFSKNEVLNFQYLEIAWLHQVVHRLGAVSFLTVDKILL